MYFRLPPGSRRESNCFGPLRPWFKHASFRCFCVAYSSNDNQYVLLRIFLNWHIYKNMGIYLNRDIFEWYSYKSNLLVLILEESTTFCNGPQSWILIELFKSWFAYFFFFFYFTLPPHRNFPSSYMGQNDILGSVAYAVLYVDYWPLRNISLLQLGFACSCTGTHVRRDDDTLALSRGV